MATDDSRPGLRGDEAELFREFNDELVRLVSHAVGTTANKRSKMLALRLGAVSAVPARS
jgi:hypothetical protein